MIRRHATTEQQAPLQIRPCTVYRHTDGRVCGQVGPHTLHFPEADQS